MMLPDVRIKTETQVVQWANRIIAATPAEQAQLLWLYRADRRKIDIVPPGVDPEQFHPMAVDEAQRILKLDPDSNLLLFVGRIERLKAIDTILHAVKLLRHDSQLPLGNTRFAIIGGDPKDLADSEIQRLVRLAKSLGIDDIVDFLGAKDHDMLRVYYSAASAVIVPSDYESFGMVALEAMASGTPVIASNVGGLAFLVEDQETGLLMPVRDPEALADSINVVLSQPEKRKLLGKNAAELAEQYAWSRIVDRLLPIFEEVANQRMPVAVSRRRR